MAGERKCKTRIRKIVKTERRRGMEEQQAHLVTHALSRYL